MAELWSVDDLRPAKVYGNGSALPSVEHDDDGFFRAPGFLVSAHKPD
ncbi:thiopurine S-methyltransferase [Mycobacterium tuberculosis]|nr:thiopurine S-methyltransferase [Mycobacterium tuberculosis]